MKALIISLALMLSASGMVKHASAQSVIIDKQVRAGDLILMQSVSSENDYYYVPDQARLATRDNGTKEFSFLRYVEPNVSTTADSSSGAGGGIVHAVVEILVSDESLRSARSDLQRLNPNGKIIGPVTFTSGKFLLISSFAKEGSDFTESVLGTGNAPILEGGRAAVSMKLTKKGAEVLWESFNTTTPDISFSFEMNIDGYRAPQQAILEADFEKIYTHKNFAAGVATPYLQAEIDATFDDLRNTGAIKLTQIGSDTSLDALIKTAYDKLTKIVFDSAGTTGSNDLVALANKNPQSMLDKASAALKTNREQTRKDNESIRKRNDDRAKRESTAAESASQVNSIRRQQGRHTSAANSARARAEAFRAQAKHYRKQAEGMAEGADKTKILTSAKGLDTLAAKEDKKAEEAVAKSNGLNDDLASKQKKADKDKALLGEDDMKDFEKVKKLPSLSIVASYKMKSVKQTGKYRVDLNKYSTATLKHRFDENIGDLRDELDNENVFRTVDLANSAFSQRELPVYIDGLNLADFGKYINFATVLMRKTHENGDETTDELKIDRDNFNQKANNFKVSYRKLGDSDSNRFLEYRYKVIWNFFGGAQVEEPWTSSRNSGIPLSPPYEKRSVFLEADAAPLADAGVRSMEFKLYYDLGGVEQVHRQSIRVRSGEAVSEEVNFMLPKSDFEYDYEVAWKLNGAQRRNLSRTSSEDGTIYLDDLPGE